MVNTALLSVRLVISAVNISGSSASMADSNAWARSRLPIHRASQVAMTFRYTTHSWRHRSESPSPLTTADHTWGGYWTGMTRMPDRCHGVFRKSHHGNRSLQKSFFNKPGWKLVCPIGNESEQHIQHQQHLRRILKKIFFGFGKVVDIMHVLEICTNWPRHSMEKIFQNPMIRC